MRMVNCGTFKRRCGKSLSTVIRHADDAEMRFGILRSVAWGRLTDGGSICRNLRNRKKQDVAPLVDTFYPTNGPQTIEIGGSHFHEPP